MRELVICLSNWKILINVLNCVDNLTETFSLVGSDHHFSDEREKKTAAAWKALSVCDCA